MLIVGTCSRIGAPFKTLSCESRVCSATRKVEIESLYVSCRWMMHTEVPGFAPTLPEDLIVATLKASGFQRFQFPPVRR